MFKFDEEHNRITLKYNTTLLGIGIGIGVGAIVMAAMGIHLIYELLPFEEDYTNSKKTSIKTPEGKFVKTTCRV